jgi:hypothetical protein
VDKVGTFVVEYNCEDPAFLSFYSALLEKERTTLVENIFMVMFSALTSEVSNVVKAHLPELLFRVALQVSLQLPGFASIYVRPVGSVMGAVAYDIIQSVMAEVLDIDLPVEKRGFISSAMQDSGQVLDLAFIESTAEPVKAMNEALASQMSLTEAETTVIQSLIHDFPPEGNLSRSFICITYAIPRVPIKINPTATTLGFAAIFLSFRNSERRIGRIELPPLAWKARALPLCNIRRLVFGPKTELCRLSYWMRFGLGVDGLEPPTVCL